MQTDRQVDAQFLARAADFRHDPAGRKGNAAAAQLNALAIHDDPHGGGDVLVVIKRLAHAHQHHVTDLARDVVGRRPLAKCVARDHQLAHDFSGA